MYKKHKNEESYKSNLNKINQLFNKSVGYETAKPTENLNIHHKTFYTILDQLPVMLSIYDHKNKAILHNQFFTKKFGWNLSDIPTIDALYVTTPDPINYGLLQKSLKVENGKWITYKMLNKKGEVIGSEWTTIYTDNKLTIRVGLDNSENANIKSEQQEIIKKLEFASQKLEERENFLQQQQKELSNTNFKLSEQNKKLEENEEIFKMLTGATYEAIFVTTNGLITQFNETAQILLEQAKNQIINTPFSSIIVPSQRLKIEEIISNNKEAQNIEVNLIKNTGKLFYGELQSKHYFHQNKNIIIFTVRDITYRKKIEISAKNNENNIKNLINNIQVGIYAQLIDGDNFANSTFSKYTGLDINAENFSILNCFQQEDKVLIAEKIEELFNYNITVWSRDIEIINQQNQIKSHFNLNLINTYFKQKQTVLFTFTDINERKQSELKIRENEQLLNSIIDNLPVIFNLLDNKGVSRRINKELEKFFELDGSVSPVGVYNLTKDVKLFGEENINYIKKAFDGENVVLKDIEVDLTKVYGRKGMENAKGIKYLDSLFTPIFDNNKKLLYIVYLGIDITDNVLKNRELELKQKDILEATKQLSEYKLVALRAVMNPHFIFNVLNSIQYFIASNDKEQALTYLSLFSKLIRKTLENSLKSKITLNEEITMLKYYIDLENLRLENRFEVDYDIDDSLLEDEVEIPTLILQPYVENSIIHGLIHKTDGIGKLSLKIVDKGDYIECIIEDNGVGRARSQQFKEMDHKSIGTKVTEERLKIINKFDEVSVKVIDLHDEYNNPSGTKTILNIKLN
ncbi:MAG: histidine kinase [Cytophagales bacterium]